MNEINAEDEENTEELEFLKRSYFKNVITEFEIIHKKKTYPVKIIKRIDDDDEDSFLIIFYSIFSELHIELKFRMTIYIEYCEYFGYIKKVYSHALVYCYKKKENLEKKYVNPKKNKRSYLITLLSSIENIRKQLYIFERICIIQGVPTQTESLQRNLLNLINDLI